MRNVMGGLFLIFVMRASQATAAPAPVLDLRELVDESDLIVTGTINNVIDGGSVTVEGSPEPVTERVVFGILSIDQLLKGDGDGRRFRTVIPADFNGFRTVPIGRYGMFFAKRRLDGDWEPTSPFYPYLPAVPGTQLNGGGFVLDNVTAVLVKACNVAPMADNRREAINALRGARSEAAFVGLRAVLQDSDPDVRMSATAVLLSAGDDGVLPLAMAELSRSDVALDSETRLNLLEGIAEGIRGQESIVPLSTLLHASSVDARRAAALALGRMSTPKAANVLAAGLDDDDPQVQYYAVTGLAKLTADRGGVPSMAAFFANSSGYLDYWRKWRSRTP